ncbi:MAG: hypothetical protein ACREUQ_03340 [Burkholderiales bacterium]
MQEKDRVSFSLIMLLTLCLCMAIATWGQQTTIPPDPCKGNPACLASSGSGTITPIFPVGHRQGTTSEACEKAGGAWRQKYVELGECAFFDSDALAKFDKEALQRLPEVAGGAPAGQHEWASELGGKKEADGCRWKRLTETVVKECPTGEFEIDYQADVMGIGIKPVAAWKETERYTLDWCILHGETRVLRVGKPPEIR